MAALLLLVGATIGTDPTTVIGWILAALVLTMVTALTVFLTVLWLKLMSQALIMLHISTKILRWLYR